MNSTQDDYTIYIKDQYGLGQILIVSSGNTVIQLAEKIRHSLEKQDEFFLLKFQGRILLNLFNTLQQEHVVQNSIINVIGLFGNSKSQIFEYPLSFCFKKQLHEIVTKLNQTGKIIKNKISQILKISCEQLQILFNDEVIENVDNIIEYGILPYKQIYVQEKCGKVTQNLLQAKSISYSYYIHRQTISQKNQIQLKNASSGFIEDSLEHENLSPTPFNLKKITQKTMDEISPIKKKKKTILNIIQNQNSRQNMIVLKSTELAQMFQSCQSQAGDSLLDRSDIMLKDLLDDKQKIVSNPENFHEIKFTDSYYDISQINKEIIDPIWLNNERGQQFKLQVKKNSTVSDIKSMLAIYEKTQKQNLSLTSPQIQFSLDDNIQLVHLSKRILNKLQICKRK